MAVDENTIVNLDITDAEDEIKTLEKVLEQLITQLDALGEKISHEFSKMAGGVEKVEKSVEKLTESLNQIMVTIENLVKQLEEGEIFDQIISGISTFFDLIFTFVSGETLLGWIKIIGEKIGGLFGANGVIATGVKGLAATLNIGVGAAAAIIIAAVAAIIAAIVLIVVYWDEIVIFFTQTLPAALAPIAEWIYTNVLQPIIEAFTPIVSFLYNVLIQPMIQYFVDAREEMQQVWADVGMWFDQNVIQPIVGFVKGAFDWFSQIFQGVWQVVSDVVYNIVSFVATGIQMIFAVCATIGTWIYLNVIEPVAGFFEDLWTDVSNWAAEKWEKIQEILAPFVEWVTENVIDPFTEGFMDMVNGVIKFINGMLDGIVGGVNGIIRAINRLQFTVPDWVPEFGGQTVGFNLKELTAPQIPYLAKGAVLPANRPFLAVVGDQRHGTNVEAPLATIQEAVGLVMNDHISAMMAGFRALLEEQQATRRTIEGIEIGDRVIGEAAQRYQRKMAVTYGTF